jgi:hypothetical protein
MRIHLFALVAALGVAACYERSPVTPQDGLLQSVPPGTVQMFVQQESSTGDGQLTFVVRVVANGVKVGAYQGAVTFSPGTLELVGVDTPKGGSGDFYIVNPAAFAQGRIKFAAYTTADAFGGTEAFRLHVKALKPVSDAMLTGHLDLAGEATGVAVSKTKLLASRGIRDAVTNQLIVP